LNNLADNTTLVEAPTERTVNSDGFQGLVKALRSMPLAATSEKSGDDPAMVHQNAMGTGLQK